MRVVRFVSLLHSGIRLLNLTGSAGLATRPAASAAQAMNRLFDLRLRRIVSCGTPSLPRRTGGSYTTLYDVYMTLTEGSGFVNLHSICNQCSDLL